MILVDGHLDIAFNHALWGRDPRRSALDVRADEGAAADGKFRGRCTVGLPEMRAGRIAVVFGTLFVMPSRVAPPQVDPAQTYDDEAGAERLARAQLDFYRELHEDADSGFRMIADGPGLREVLEGWEDGATGDVGLLPLMEGADPIRDPERVSEWFEAGVRIVGLSWKGTRYSGGTGEPGPLTALGRELVPALGEAGILLDLSHASEKAFHESLDLASGPVLASHSNPRALCEGDRQLTDEMIRALAGRDGVIGVVPFNVMLQSGWRDAGCPEVPLDRVAEAIQHVSDVAGRHEVVAIGSDLDGGFGAEATPAGIDTIADLPRLADVLADRHFTDEMIYDILGRNWLRYLERNLPG